MVMSTGLGVGRRGRGKKGGENMVPVVERGREGGILEARGEKGRWSKRGRRKKARELESISVGPGAGHPVIFGNSFVKRGGNVKEPSGSQL